MCALFYDGCSSAHCASMMFGCASVAVFQCVHCNVWVACFKYRLHCFESSQSIVCSSMCDVPLTDVCAFVHMCACGFVEVPQCVFIVVFGFSDAHAVFRFLVYRNVHSVFLCLV